MGKAKKVIIPWYKMPLQLRALPFKDRAEALAKWEQQHGDYMIGRNKACLKERRESGKGWPRSAVSTSESLKLQNPEAP